MVLASGGGREEHFVARLVVGPLDSVLKAADRVAATVARMGAACRILWISVATSPIDSVGYPSGVPVYRDSGKLGESMSDGSEFPRRGRAGDQRQRASTECPGASVCPNSWRRCSQLAKHWGPTSPLGGLGAPFAPPQWRPCNLCWSHCSRSGFGTGARTRKIREADTGAGHVGRAE